MGSHSTWYPAEVRDQVVRLVLDHQGEYGSLAASLRDAN